MNQHLKSYLIASIVLTVIRRILQHRVFPPLSKQVDPRGHFSGTQATESSLTGLIQEIRQLPQ